MKPNTMLEMPQGTMSRARAIFFLFHRMKPPTASTAPWPRSPNMMPNSTVKVMDTKAVMSISP